MIVLFTDFGLAGPYVGQLHALLAQQAPGVTVIDLFHDAPNHDVRAAAYLLPAYTQGFPPGTVYVGVVDPGVGSERSAVILNADHRWYVGPDNGLFEIVARRAQSREWREILWRPARLSASFHGRDLFAPVAAMLARGVVPESRIATPVSPGGAWPEDLAQVVYVDRFGNFLTGIRASAVPRRARIGIAGSELVYARTYADAAAGQGFWYENANGLVEIALNRERADRRFGAAVGTPVNVLLV